jgi:hypothetical protein
MPQIVAGPGILGTGISQTHDEPHVFQWFIVFGSLVFDFGKVTDSGLKTKNPKPFLNK